MPVAFDGMAALLRMLSEKNIRIATVTGKGIHSTAISLRQFGIDDYLSRWKPAGCIGPRKPEGIEAVPRLLTV